MVDVRDVAEVIAKICLSPYPLWRKVFNVSSGTPVSVLKLAQTCIEVAEAMGASPGKIELNDYQAPSFGMSNIKLCEQFDWSAKYTLKGSISDLAREISRCKTVTVQ